MWLLSMKLSRGFTLIELMCYISGVTVVILIVFQFQAVHQRRIMQHACQLDRLMGLYAALDVLAHDGMSIAQAGVQQLSSAHYLLRSAGHDVGWRLEKGRLLRTSGSFDRVSKKWKQKQSCVVASGIFDFSLLREDAGYRARISYNDGGCTKEISHMIGACR